MMNCKACLLYIDTQIVKSNTLQNDKTLDSIGVGKLQISGC